MLLQNIQLVVGKRYESEEERKRANRPLFSVVMDEFAPFGYQNFSQILNTARGTNTAFLFSMQSLTQLLKVGKIATLVLGVIVVAVAHRMSALKGVGLFNLMQNVSILIATPIIVPMFWGLIIKRTPPWSAWSTVLVGFICSLFISDHFTPEWAARLFDHPVPLTAIARENWTQAIELFGNVAIGSAWFIGTKLFWNRTTSLYRAETEAFFLKLNTPVNFAAEEGAGTANDSQQSSVVGRLCLAYGSFVVLLAFIPNPWPGRLAFIGCGLLILTVGMALTRSAKRPG
jgi:hypothetical protein